MFDKIKYFCNITLNILISSLYFTIFCLTSLPVGVSESLSRVQLFATPWTVAHLAPLSMEFWQDYWNRLPFPSPEDLPNPGIEPGSSVLQADSLSYEPPVVRSGLFPHLTVIKKMNYYSFVPKFYCKFIEAKVSAYALCCWEIPRLWEINRPVL